MWSAIKVAFFFALGVAAMLLAGRQRGKETNAHGRAEVAGRINQNRGVAIEARREQTIARRKAEAHEKTADALLKKVKNENETVGAFISRWNS